MVAVGQLHTLNSLKFLNLSGTRAAPAEIGHLSQLQVGLLNLSGLDLPAEAYASWEGITF